MPLSSRRLEWFGNTAIRTCDFLPLSLFTDDLTVKASHSHVLQLSAGTVLTESRIKEASFFGGVVGPIIKFSHS